MEDSAFQALMIGVNTFIFIIALTAGIMLMGEINDLVEYTKQETASASTGSLVETFGKTSERIFTGAEVYALYGQQEKGELPNDLIIEIITEADDYDLIEYVKVGLSYLEEKFKLEQRRN